MLYTVKDVAHKTGLTPYTIRFYLKEGLLPAVERNSVGTRLFKETDLESIYMIECMKRCRMSIAEIRQYMQWLDEGDKNIGKCLALFSEKQKVLEQEMIRLKECLEAVEYKVWYYQAAEQAGTISIHKNMPQENIPKKMREIRSRMIHVTRLTEDKTKSSMN